DLRWKRTAYTSLPSLTHYIVIAQDAVEVIIFARDDGFGERRIRSIDKAIELRSLAISLPVAENYPYTRLVAKALADCRKRSAAWERKTAAVAFSSDCAIADSPLSTGRRSMP